MESPYFEHACTALERATSLSRLEARGTVRFALKAVGFESRSVNRPQMLATILQSLPTELSRKGVDEAQTVCNRVAEALAGYQAEA